MARRLLGARLVRVMPGGERLAGTIVEVEAYLGVEDAAAHSFGGRRTPRVEPMYGPPGTAYVYFTYGMHHCMNVACGREGEPVAVLIRALEPTEGLDTMRRHRLGHQRPGRGVPIVPKTNKRRPGDAKTDKPMPETSLCSGPAKLCQALALDRSHSGLDLVDHAWLFIERIRFRPLPESALGNTPRIGVDYAGDWADEPLRWFLRGNPHVSGPRRAGPARIRS